MLFVILIHAIIGVALRVAEFVRLFLLPLSMSVLQAVPELACVTAAILPFVLTKAFRLSISVLPDVAVSIGKEVRAIAVSQALQPLTFIFIPVRKNVNTITLRFPCLPLANVRLAIVSLPNTVAVLDTHVPFTIVDLAVLPRVHTFSIGFTSLICPVVVVTGGEKLITTPTASVLAPFAFVNPTGEVDKDAQALALPIIIELATINATIFVLLDAKCAFFANLFIIKLITDHLIFFNSVTIVFELSVLFARRSETFLHQLFVDLSRNFTTPPAATCNFLSFFFCWLFSTLIVVVLAIQGLILALL